MKFYSLPSFRQNPPTRLAGLAMLTAAFTALTATLPAQTLATGDTRSVSQPSNPSTCMTVTAIHTLSQRSSPPSSDDTSLLSSALSSCAGTGKAVVLASSGSNNAFYAGNLTVNGEALVVNSGVTLLGNKYSGTQWISVKGNNSGFYGPGTIDGRADVFSGSSRLINTSGVNNFVAYNVTLKESQKMHLYIEGGNGVTVWNVTLRTPANTANTDGIDLDSLTNATVYGSDVEAGDDGIVVKTNSAAASNITVRSNKLHGTHGLSIGSQTFDGVTNVLFDSNYVYGADLQGTVSSNANAINIKTDPTCGGAVKQVTYRNTCVTGAKHLIIMDTAYGSCSGTAGTPQFTDIVVVGAKIVSSGSGAYSTFRGYSSSKLSQAYLGYVSSDVTKTQNNQDFTVYEDSSNVVPTGTGVTTPSFTISGSVPTCTF